MQKKSLQLTDPLLIGSLFILLLNDLWLKYSFPGIITGKLSDFSGLMASVLFLLVWFPRHKKDIIFLITILFVFWKSPFSQALIDTWNLLNILPVKRVVDPTDLLALLTLPMIYYYQLRPLKGRLFPYLRIPLALIAIFAFCATSYNKSYEYNKSYSFPCSLKELVDKLNAIDKKCNMVPLSLDITLADTILSYGTDTNFFSYGDSLHVFRDTLYKYDKIRKVSTGIIDTIRVYKYKNKDTVIIHGANSITLLFDIQDILIKKDKSGCDCVEARVAITGGATASQILLETIYNNSYGSFKEKGEKEKKELLLEEFEKQYINMLKK